MTKTQSLLRFLQITNQCVVVCDLTIWSSSESPAWQLYKGTQEEVGRDIAELLDQTETSRLDDFGGVCETFLCKGDEYLETPPRTRTSAAIFSFTPKNRVINEGYDMARAAKAAGFGLLILTVQKHDKFGKVWVLSGILRYLRRSRLVYYEDTAAIVDELKTSPERDKVIVVHVQSLGYEDQASMYADRVINQSQYQREVLYE